jgi:hypothetical protein
MPGGFLCAFAALREKNGFPPSRKGAKKKQIVFVRSMTFEPVF